MRKYLFVVFLILSFDSAHANSLSEAIDSIERDWANTYYTDKQADAPAAYQKLLSKTQMLSSEYPKQAEPLLWQAIILATDADHQAPLTALEQVAKARDLLIAAIALDPNGVNGAAQTTLATLYYMTPPWPISFGDTAKAKELFHSALKINPQSIEANYFYGDFLVSEHHTIEAEAYYKAAVQIPPRKNQLLADNSLQQQASFALNKNNERKLNNSKKLFLSSVKNSSVIDSKAQ